MKLRKIKNIYPTVGENIGGLETQRAIPTQYVNYIDPFLFLNHHGPQTYPPQNQGLPFAPHPHRGFETVTFILEGDVAHKDSKGHESIIEGGGIQWMTAGSGIVHEELSSQKFKQEGGPVEFLQLWVNLPKEHKMTNPRYAGLQSDQIKTFQDQEGVSFRPISGELKNETGPIETFSRVSLSTIELVKGKTFEVKIPTDHNVFFYLVRGKINLNDTQVSAFHLVDFENDEQSLKIKALESSYIILGHAKPFNEPVVAQGPFVMNTREEIIKAYEDYHAGLFA